jgi:hypothetical protein
MLEREVRNMIVWHIKLLVASAAVAKLSDSDDRQLFLISTIPAVVYSLAALALWLVTNRRAIGNRQVSLRSFLILIGVLSPGLAMLRLVYWPYWLWR